MNLGFRLPRVRRSAGAKSGMGPRRALQSLRGLQHLLSDSSRSRPSDSGRMELLPSPNSWSEEVRTAVDRIERSGQLAT
jgi:hypothetical protein